jgi:hypothetical protein
MASDVGMLPDETDATRQLQAMLEQLRRDPRAALGVDARPTAEAVRSQFLVQTKRFHPTKFARMSPGVVRLANEVFIAIRQAHDALVRELGAVPTSIREPAARRRRPPLQPSRQPRARPRHLVRAPCRRRLRPARTRAGSRSNVQGHPPRPPLPGPLPLPMQTWPRERAAIGHRRGRAPRRP